MSLLTNDPQLQLAFSLHENKGVLAILIGSGLSRSAEIPTGWEMTIDLIRQIGITKGVEEQTDWSSWYRDQTGDEPNYSTLLESLGASPEERRAILHGYIEPSEEEFQEGKKIPTPAHRAIAELVRKGYVRVIITTNFDRLMENALRECGVEPTVVASVDALKGAEPITHSTCYILKIHGDYKDARILNTDAELSSYPAEYDRLLDRILDEYGLIICGWSGEWDHALRQAFLRAPNRRYPMFWAARGKLGGGAEELLRHRAGRLVSIADANTFFSTLVQSVETLAQTQQKNPLGIELLVNNTKRLLAKPEYRIQLDELLTQEASRVIESLGRADFAATGQWSQSEFRIRVSKFEALAESLSCMCGVLGRWGNGSEVSLIFDVIRSLLAAPGNQGGQVAYINLKSYPATLVFTAYCLGITRAERWDILRKVLNTTLDQEYPEPRRSVETLFLHTWKGAENNAWSNIDGLEKRKTPLSDHLAALFAVWGKRFLSLTPDFELLFERFELLGSCVHLERETKETLQSGLGGDAWRRDSIWMPVGRVGWHSQNASKLIAEFQSESMKGTLVSAGFANGEAELFDLFIQNFTRIADRMQW
jgi:hypothetical protein